MNLLSFFEPMDAEKIPFNSILREFIGGSILFSRLIRQNQILITNDIIVITILTITNGTVITMHIVYSLLVSPQNYKVAF